MHRRENVPSCGSSRHTNGLIVSIAMKLPTRGCGGEQTRVPVDGCCGEGSPTGYSEKSMGGTSASSLRPRPFGHIPPLGTSC